MKTIDYQGVQKTGQVLALESTGYVLARHSAFTLPVIRIACALLSAILLIISFPDYDIGLAAWIALVPIALASTNMRFTSAFGLGLVAGIVATFGICGWIFNVPHFGMLQAIPLALYLSLYPALWCAGLVVLKRTRLPFIITGAALWVALDFLRAHAGFLAFPWATLAQSQHTDLPLLQTASLTGEAGITFVVVLVNLAIVTGLIKRQWRPLIVSIVALVILHLGGAITIANTAYAPGLQVAVIQPAITRTEAANQHGWNTSLGRLERLTRAARATTPRPDLLVWPETAVRNFDSTPALVRRIKNLAAGIGAPIIFGSSDTVTAFARTNKGFRIHYRDHDAAWMVPVHAAMPKPYDKIVLLPFVEYRPFARWFRWPQWLVTPWTFHTIQGHRRTLFKFGTGVRVAPVICWEILFSDRIRHSVADGAQLIVHLVNDNWFGKSAEPRQHELASVMRAVENRVPVVVASNTGPSEIIGPSGRVIARGPGLFTSGVLAAAVSLGGGSPYTHYGDLFAWLCIIVVMLAFGYGVATAWQRKQKRLLLPARMMTNTRRRYEKNT